MKMCIEFVCIKRGRDHGTIFVLSQERREEVKTKGRDTDSQNDRNSLLMSVAEKNRQAESLCLSPSCCN